jgi:hypothetical protein
MENSKKANGMLEYRLYSTTLFRGCSTLLYRCPDAGVYKTCSCAGALTISNSCTGSAAQFI